MQLCSCCNFAYRVLYVDLAWEDKIKRDLGSSCSPPTTHCWFSISDGRLAGVYVRDLGISNRKRCDAGSPSRASGRVRSRTSLHTVSTLTTPQVRAL